MISIAFTGTPKYQPVPKSPRPFDRLNTLLLVAANLFAFYLLNKNNVPGTMLLLLYAFQGIFIIILNTFRILLLKEFRTDKLLLNGRKVDPVPSTKRELSLTSFTIFMAFEIAYIVFIFAILMYTNQYTPEGNMYSGLLDYIDWAWIIPALIPFIVHHIISWLPEIIYLRGLKGKQAPHAGEMAFLPLKRILPLHLMVILMPLLVMSNTVALLVIVIIKTIFDVILHESRKGHAA